MASPHFAILAIYVAALIIVAHSQANELTISQPRGAHLTNVNVTIDFPAEAVIGKCNVAERVCGRIVGHQEKFTIRAHTNLPVGEHYFRVNGKTGDFKFIIANDYRLIAPPEQRLRGLEVQYTAVRRDATFTVPFLIANMQYGIPYRSDSQQTFILLNGAMSSTPVYLQFAANKNGSGEKFTLKICPDSLNCAVDIHADDRAAKAGYSRRQPTSTATNAFSIVFIFLWSARMLVEV